MQKSAGFSLFEAIVIIGLLAIIALPLIGQYTKSKSNQELIFTTDQFADNARRAQLFAQNEKNSHSWGILSTDNTQYSLISWQTLPKHATPTTWTVHETKKMPKTVHFTNSFLIHFQQGTGTATAATVEIVNTNNIKTQISVIETGIINVKTLP